MDMRKNFVPPMSLANMRPNGVYSVSAVCEICRHETVVNVDALPETTFVPEVGRQLRCSQCGGKQIDTRPAWQTARDAWGRPEVRPHEEP
jgi:hypothetical protein